MQLGPANFAFLKPHDVQLVRLPKLDQAILAKAFRGELVPQDANDEPVEICATTAAESLARRGRRQQATN